MNERVEFQQISGIPKTSLKAEPTFHKWGLKKKKNRRRQSLVSNYILSAHSKTLQHQETILKKGC